MLPVYAGTDRKNSLVGGASLWVMKGHRRAEYKGAAAFLNFIAQPEQALFWSTNTGYIPVTKTGFDFMVKNGFYDKAPYKGRETAIASLSPPPSRPPVTRGIRLGDHAADPPRSRQRTCRRSSPTRPRSSKASTTPPSARTTSSPAAASIRARPCPDPANPSRPGTPGRDPARGHRLTADRYPALGSARAVAAATPRVEPAAAVTTDKRAIFKNSWLGFAFASRSCS